MKIEDKVILLVKKFSKINESDISSATRIKDLKFDSLDLLEFQMGIDDEFGVELGIEDFLKCQNVEDISVLVESHYKLK